MFIQQYNSLFQMKNNVLVDMVYNIKYQLLDFQKYFCF